MFDDVVHADEIKAAGQVFQSIERAMINREPQPLSGEFNRAINDLDALGFPVRVFFHAEQKNPLGATDIQQKRRGESLSVGLMI